MYHELEARVRKQLAAFISRRYGIETCFHRASSATAMGEMASPISFELAKRLKRAPRQIAQEIAIGDRCDPGRRKIRSRRRGIFKYIS